MAPSTVLRRLTVGVALIVALAACGSTAVPTTAPVVAPAVAPAVAPTATSAATPIATSAATPTATPTATPVTSADIRKYTRDFVAKSFTDKFGLTFTVETADTYGSEAPYWVISSANSPVGVAIRGLTKTGDGGVRLVRVAYHELVTISQEMTFAVSLMVDPDVASEANAWVQSELAKANANKNTEVDESKNFHATILSFLSNHPMIGPGGISSQGGPGLTIEQTSPNQP
jgi:hypothetical protein